VLNSSADQIRRIASAFEKRYNKSRMNAGTLRLLLVGCLLAMYLLAMVYLRRRPLTPGQFAAWGLLALFVPALGPFLVILSRPGRPAAAVSAGARRR
jgi:hypothetical protein